MLYQSVAVKSVLSLDVKLSIYRSIFAPSQKLGVVTKRMTVDTSNRNNIPP